MKLYHNIMEDLVEEYYDDIASRQNICTCERCRNDTVALALILFEFITRHDTPEVLTMVCTQACAV